MQLDSTSDTLVILCSALSNSCACADCFMFKAPCWLLCFSRTQPVLQITLHLLNRCGSLLLLISSALPPQIYKLYYLCWKGLPPHDNEVALSGPAHDARSKNLKSPNYNGIPCSFSVNDAVTKDLKLNLERYCYYYLLQCPMSAASKL